jgi:para-nitrobenzyl esterase
MSSTWRHCSLPAILFLVASTGGTETVHVDSGAVEGMNRGGVVAWLGVPFAAPPVGPLRWREPQPVVPWTGTRRADSFAPACPQLGVSMPGEESPRTDEDCLYLNIWRPLQPVNARLPVLVWIHGGAYRNGSASMPLYWGDRLARRGVVIVAIAYRLGPLGFLAHPELTAESAHHSSGNYGLLDQVAALEWVKRNISAFGGDPGRVTIAGQSSGAMSVSILVASPRARGLFHRAIGQSGGLFEPLQIAPSYLLKNAERDGQGYVASLGSGSIAELRRRPVADLLGGKAASVSHPVIEPHLLPLTPYDALGSGSYNDVPTLIGFNAEEARAMVDVKEVNAANFDAGIKQSFGALPSALLQGYERRTDAEAQQARLDFERDLRFGWDMWAWAKKQRTSGESPVYFYYFEHAPPFPAGSVRATWGASHFAELWYMFDHLGQETWRWSSVDHQLAATMASYWTNFAKSGDPNGRGLPLWEAFDGRRVLHLGSQVATDKLPNAERLRAFDAVYDAMRDTPLAPP